MLPVPWIVVVLYIIGYALLGMAIGVLTAVALSLALRLKIRRVIKGGLLGSFGFLFGFIATVYMPWPENTVTYSLENGGSVSSTMHSYQHPGIVGVVFAILLPMLHLLFRFKREHSRIV